MNYVIDTNLTVVANGKDTHADLNCQLACIEFLQAIMSRRNGDAVAIDDDGLILGEYRRYLSYSGNPGVGDVFFKYLHDNLTSDRVLLTNITPILDEDRGFSELPRNALDKSDRKFLAVALSSMACIANAVDNDWHEQRLMIERLGVPVRQLCPQHACTEAPQQRASRPPRRMGPS